ncbi:MAG: RHS repeat-associated core domain-containing protein, partial [Peptococcaceae bacterium]|nr:RHS repeat-associated core domain-containing protein [Peptococcaceae bacterium]
RYIYDAWGKTVSVQNASGTEISSQTHIAHINPFRYRGYYFDVETGLYYLGSRYYDPETGRFINSDELVCTGQGSLVNNMFTYCLNNPVNCKDSTGMWPEWASWVGVGLLLVGLTVLTVMTLGTGAIITGPAATIVVGTTIGAYCGTGFSIGSQARSGNGISGNQVLRGCVGGALAGGISAIPVGHTGTMAL